MANRAKSYLLEKSENIALYNIRLEAINSTLAKAYALSGKLDSSYFFLRISLQHSKINGNVNDYKDLKQLEAKLNYYTNNFSQSLDSLNKYTLISNEHEDNFYYIGEVHSKLGDKQKAVQQMLIRDSLLANMGYPLRDNVVETYQFLLDHALENKNETKSKEYFQRLVYYDSLLQATQAAVRKITLEDFDIPLEREEKASLFSALEQKSSNLQWLYAIAFVLLITSIGLYINQNNTKNRLKQVMAQTIELEAYPHVVSQEISKLQPSEELAEAIKEWEEDKGFLDPEVSLQALAKRFDTNTAYLSRNINLLKGQNFSSYLKDIRVTHAINYMKSH
ncbi:MAG: hypothetical protein AAGL34_14290, partial [Bacteroidota bacterium]